MVHRKSWYRHSRIQFIDRFKFVQLSSDLGKTNWSPYRDDFTANDWEVIESDSDKPTVLGGLFRTLIG
jgi:hypothetical protein